MQVSKPEIVLLSIGSNIEPERFLVEAVELLARQLSIDRVSRVFETLPVGEGPAASFLNAALAIHCDEEPEDLKFRILRPLEAELGRVRTSNPNSPRTIDVDISLFGQRIVHQRGAQLEIPDPEILTQAHVAIPLADVAPDVTHPQTGQTMAAIASRFDDRGVRIRPELELWPQSDKL